MSMEEVMKITAAEELNKVSTEQLSLETVDPFDVEGTEDIAKREESVKHFHLGNNRYQAIIYPEAVHYREEDGKWTEIDNTLERVTVGGRKMLRNKAAEMRIELAEEADEQTLVRLTNKGRNLNWAFENPADLKKKSGKAGRAPHAFAVKRAYSEDISKKTWKEKRGMLKNHQSGVSYANMLPGVSVNYTLIGNKLKEDIIVENAEALGQVALKLPSEGFDYAVEEDMGVSVCDAKTRETLFHFMPPAVYDSAEPALQTIANVKLTPCDGYVRMQYELDEAFVNGAVYPITIDPVSHSSGAPTNVEDTTICEATPTSNYGSIDYMKVGVSASKENVALVRFKELAALKCSDTITRAVLNLRMKSGSSGSYIGAYGVKKSWDVSKVTWDTFKPTDSAKIDPLAQECIAGASSGTVSFDLTNLFRTWYIATPTGDDANFGVALRRPQNVTGDQYQEIYTANHATASYHPTMSVNYISHAGLEGWWTYESQSAGRAGTANVDLFNGNMVFSHTDTNMNGSRAPVSITHYYNSCLSDKNDCFSGFGWRTSLHQYMDGKTVNSVNYYVWTDENGTEHYFKRSGSEPFKDEEGMGLKLTTSTSSSTPYMIIDDKDHNRLKFEKKTNWTKYWLTSIRDAHANQSDLTHESEGKITKVKDAAGRETKFQYSGSLISSIAYPGAIDLVTGLAADQKVTFSYSSNRLIGVLYSDVGGSTAHTVYGYDGSTAILTSAKNYDGTRVNIGYEAKSLYNAERLTGASDQMRRVTSMETVAVDSAGAVIARGAKQVIEYKHMCTEVKAVDTTSAETGKVLAYQFNDAGNVVCIKDELGFAQFTKYSSAYGNAPTDESKLQKAVMNRLRYPDMKNVGSTWAVAKNNTADTVSRDTGTTCISVPSVKVIKTTSGGESKCTQAATVENGKSWTFSAYVKATSLTGGNAFIRLKGSSSDVITGTTSGSGGPGADGWERVSVTVALTGTGTQSVTAEMVSTATSGTAWFACPQLEEGVLANRVNLVTNGDFRKTVTNASRQFPEDWTAGSNVSSSTQNGVFTPGADFPKALGGKYAQVIGLPDKAENGYTQQIGLMGKKNDIIVLGGWANAQSVPNANTIGRGFGLSIRYQKTSDSSWSDYKMLPFNAEWVGWQFGCFPVKMADDYKNVEILCVYTKNANTAQFSNIFLHREEFGQSFAYDANKNLTSIGTLAGQQSEQKYDAFDNVISYIQPGRDKTDENRYKLEYGSTDALKKRHQPTKVTTPMGVITENTYDEHGNLTDTKTHGSAATPFIQSKIEYEGDMGSAYNYPFSSVDARGKQTHYGYDSDTGNLQWVEDANSNVVIYQYDASNRVKEVCIDGDEGNGFIQYKNAYTYDKDRLRTVSHNTMSNATNDVTYTFEYDDLGNQTVVKVGSQALSTNVYNTTDRSRNLQRVDYGNGQKVHYAYDEFDRLTDVKYDAETTQRYTYEYGAHGEIGRVTDSVLGRTTTMDYDLAMRPMRVTAKSGNTLLYQTTLGYDKYNNLTSLKEETEANTSYQTTYVYDSDGRPTGVLTLFQEETEADASCETTYAYDRDNRPTSVQYNDSTHKVGYGYDGLGRITSRTVTNGTKSVATAYGFIAGGHGTGSTTPLISTITQSGQNLTYDYDNVGNIISEKREAKTTTYKYDMAGQLTRVNDPNDGAGGSSGTTWVYAYDRGGNILSRKRYAYTTGTVGTVQETVNYEYNTTWKDKLDKYGGKTVAHDAIGNLTDDGIWAYTWQGGRQLKSMAKSGMTVSYKYDHNGLRVEKDAGGAKTTYTYFGKNVTRINVGGTKLYFFYDAQGRPGMVRLNSAYYTYVYNLQGDVIALLDSNNAQVVEYRYDAWGRLLSTTGSMASTLGKHNPFRYRGYVYDEETELYYLRSRYYNPLWGRFISADSLLGRRGKLFSHNLYAYCKNSPVMRIDPDGYSGVSLETAMDPAGIEAAKTVDITQPLLSLMRKNRKILKEYRETHGFIDSLKFFIDKVRNYGDWDLKRLLEWERYENKNNIYFRGEIIGRDPADVGNIHFGYIGSALFDESTLLGGAGMYQIWSDTAKFNFWYTNFDDPRDQQCIRYGYHLALYYGEE